ncbi:MAG: hypothetical protein ACK4F9_04125 [Brevinematia bacterium]
MLYKCSPQPLLEKDLKHVFGSWIHEKIIYSNYTLDSDPIIYVFKDVFLGVTDNISNYGGEVISYITNTQAIVWGVDLSKDKFFIRIDITNFEYTVNLVSVDSTDVNYLWFMDGIYKISNTNYYFFVSNNIKTYVLRKLQ